MSSTRAKIGFGVLVAMLAVAGVRVFSQDARHSPSQRLISQHVISMSIAKEYSTLAELRNAADVVALVLVEGEPSPSTRLANIPTVDVRLRVEHVIAGAVQIGDTLTLVQYGDLSGHVIVEDSIPFLQSGKRYVVYLNRQFPDQPQMFLTGQDGVFEAGSANEFHRLGAASTNLPNSFSPNQF